MCDGEDLAFIRRRVQELVQPGPGASEGMVVYDYEQASRRGERQRGLRSNNAGSTPRALAQTTSWIVCIV